MHHEKDVMLEPNPKTVYGGTIPKTEGLDKCWDGRYSRSKCHLTNTDLVFRMPLKGAQEGLVLTITSQDCIVHWPGSIPEDSSTRRVSTTTTTILLYQEGDSICDLEASTKVISNSDSMETNANNRTVHAREVLMVRRPRSPLIPQKHPTSGHQKNLSPTYHPLPRAMMVRPRVRGKPEKEKTN